VNTYNYLDEVNAYGYKILKQMREECFQLKWPQLA